MGSDKKNFKKGNWSEEDNLQILNLWQKYESELRNFNQSPYIYDEIVRQINGKFTAQEVHIKIRNLRGRYKAETCKVNDTGVCSKWAYYGHVQRIIEGNSPNDNLIFDPLSIVKEDRSCYNSSNSPTLGVTESNMPKLPIKLDRSVKVRPLKISPAQSTSSISTLLVPLKSGNPQTDCSPIPSPSSMTSWSEHLEGTLRKKLFSNNRTKKRRKKRHEWTKEDNLLVLHIWEKYRNKLSKEKHNSHVYAEIAQAFQNKFTKLEVYTKIRNLSQRYRAEKAETDTSGSLSNWMYYNRVHKILSDNSPNNDSLLDTYSVERENSISPSPSISFSPTILTPSSTRLTKLRQNESLKKPLREISPAPSTLSTCSEPSQSSKSKKKRIRHEWNKKDNLLILDLWEESESQLYNSKRNKKFFTHIAEKLPGKFTRKEVRNKIRNLCQRYRAEKLEMKTSGCASKWPYYDRVHKIIGDNVNKNTNSESFQLVDVYELNEFPDSSKSCSSSLLAPPDQANTVSRHEEKYTPHENVASVSAIKVTAPTAPTSESMTEPLVVCTCSAQEKEDNFGKEILESIKEQNKILQKQTEQNDAQFALMQNVFTVFQKFAERQEDTNKLLNELIKKMSENK